MQKNFSPAVFSSNEKCNELDKCPKMQEFKHFLAFTITKLLLILENFVEYSKKTTEACRSYILQCTRTCEKNLLLVLLNFRANAVFVAFL